VIFINIETRASGEFLSVLRAWEREFREFFVDFNHSRESKFNFGASYCETTGFSISFICSCDSENYHFTNDEIWCERLAGIPPRRKRLSVLSLSPPSERVLR